jgi:hypothetical protein
LPTLALLIWPAIVLGLFAALPQRAALVWSLMTGYLYLPERFSIDLPGVPAIDKVSVVSMSLVLALMLFRRTGRKNSAISKPLELHNQSRWFGLVIFGLIALLFINQALTVATNRAPIVLDGAVVPGMSSWDLVSASASTIFMIVPFFLGRLYLARPEDHAFLLRCLVFSALIYSLLILIEARLSPQLHSWVYGFHQHSFMQHVRGGGYRPKVFLKHGLWVGLFLFTAVLASAALIRRAEEGGRLKWALATLWILAVLLVSRNLGAVFITLLILPLMFVSRRLAMIGATGIAFTVLCYPALRQAHVIPVDWIASLTRTISEERAASFEFRLRNEDVLLARAAEKPLSGWGGYGRSRNLNDRGEFTDTVDGLWISTLGSNGWLGYIGFFGLLIFPILALSRASKRKEIPIATLALSLIMAGNLIYLIPNSALSPIGWLMAGAIAGFVQFDARAGKGQVTETAAAVRKPDIRYTRFDARKPRTPRPASVRR